MENQASLHDIAFHLEQQKAAFLQMPYPSEKLRKQQLRALKKALLKYKSKLIKAISADFGRRAFDESILAEILPIILSINHTIKHLRQWMTPEKRKVSMLFQPASSRIMVQPLGVIGIIAPWTYPIFLSLGPIIAAIAAGNRVILKPSEFTPYSNRILKEILTDAFSPDEVSLFEGDAELASGFAGLPFDHLLFTGSTPVGKLVMGAAAKNLTPVTLELGGKSPAIICNDVSADFAVERMLYGKCLNAGQSCVAPDYVLCPESMQNALIESFKNRFAELYPDLNSGQYSSIINDRHYARIQNLLNDALEKGAKGIPLGEKSEHLPRSMPLQLLINPNEDMLIMQQEIFGPILPIVTYQQLSEAISSVKKGARPLAMYLFTKSKSAENQVLMQSHAGGMCINDTLSHVVQNDLPFGGVGYSGMGKYHAREGFMTFSASKSIYKRGRFNTAKMVQPTYGKVFQRLIERLYLN